MVGLFMGSKESIEFESDLIDRFLRTLDEIDCYLDEYDEFFGLAFADLDPVNRLVKLTKFLQERKDSLKNYCEVN